MLSHLPPFCNAFPAHPLPAWRGAWASWRRRGRPHRVTVVWRTLDLARSAPLSRDLQAGHTPLHLSTTHPPGTCTYSPMKYSAASRWRTPRATSVCTHDASARRQQPHAQARAATGLYTPDCSAAIVQEHRSMGRLLWRTRPMTRGIWRDTPGDLERHSRGFGETLQGIWRDTPGDLERRKVRQHPENQYVNSLRLLDFHET
jgi:hypothetical protein